MIPHIISRAYIAGDWNDCTCIALSNATGLSPHESNRIISEEGRRRGCGFRIDWLGHLLREQYGFELCEWTNIKLKRLMPFMQQGTYYCCTRQHAFVVKDGVVHDNNEPDENGKVIRVWRKI